MHFLGGCIHDVCYLFFYLYDATAYLTYYSTIMKITVSILDKDGKPYVPHEDSSHQYLNINHVDIKVKQEANFFKFDLCLQRAFQKLLTGTIASDDVISIQLRDQLTNVHECQNPITQDIAIQLPEWTHEEFKDLR